MTNQQIKRAVKQMRAFRLLKMCGLADTLSRTPQTFDQLSANLDCPKSKIRNSLAAGIKAGIVKECDKVQTEKGHGGYLTFAATPDFERCLIPYDFLLSANEAAVICAVADDVFNEPMTKNKIAETCGLNAQAVLVALNSLLEKEFVLRRPGVDRGRMVWFWAETKSGAVWAAKFLEAFFLECSPE